MKGTRKLDWNKLRLVGQATMKVSLQFLIIFLLKEMDTLVSFYAFFSQGKHFFFCACVCDSLFDLLNTDPFGKKDLH